MASPLTTESEPISRSSPPPSACSKWAGGPAPGPFPAHCGFALDAAENTAPAPRCRPSSSSQGPSGHRRALCPSGTLGHTLYRLPCPHTKSLSGQLTLLYIHRRTHPPPSPVSVPDPKVAETVTRVKVPTCPDDDGI
ncbi:hypothetical protein JEQ12_004774 [Ovis aries]|uniref:Uncharacterized protein n=1 Tax=Ovis aries TaxID=9940 RepID=A0A836A095_SHEEP|nr:hypothetical protein JEQ12_004774 [Ovis aries]